MALIHDLQAELLNEDKSVGFVLLKLKFLASKLGADILDDWVQHEIGGYPDGLPVPSYREAKITYTGTFVNAVRQMNNVPIPSYLIEEHAGKTWTQYEIRSSLSIIDQQMKEKGEKARFGIDASNLALLLEGKIFEGMSVISINSDIDIGCFLNIQHTVRARALDFVLKLEKEIPSVVDIEIGGAVADVSANDMETVTHLTQQVIYGGVTNITASGDKVALQVSVKKGDVSSLVDALAANGIPEQDARELAEIARTTPEKLNEDGTENWLQGKLKQGAVEAWGIGKEVAKSVITQAVKEYLGM